MNKRKIISLVVALASALGMMPGAYANNSELFIKPNYTTYVITLSGFAGEEYADKQVNIEILKPLGEGVTTLPNITPDNFNTACILFSSTTVNSDGNFEYKFKLSQSAREENPFWARVNVDATSEDKGDIFFTKSFSYTSKQEIDTKLAEMKTAVNTDTLEADAQLMGITLPVVWGRFDPIQKSYAAAEISKQINEDTTELTTEALKTYVEEGIMLAAAKNANNAVQLKEFLTQDGVSQYFGLELSNTYYTQLTSQQDVFDRMKAVITAEAEKADIPRIFREGLLLENVQNASYKNNIPAILTDFSDVISAENVVAYSAVTNPTVLDSIHSAVIEATDIQLADITAFNAMLSASITNASSAVITPPQSGGGGGGSSSSKRGSSGLVIAETPVSKEEGTVIDDVFSDISGHSWAIEAITALYEKGIVSGKGDGLYSPDDFVTREEIVKMICSAFNIPVSDTDAGFADIKGKWFEKYVNAAYEKGIISGISDGIFGAGIQATREDIVVILARAAGETIEGEVNFTDAEKISDYAKNAIAALSSKGVISGYPNGTIRPKNNMTRAEAAVVIYNLLRIYE